MPLCRVCVSDSETLIATSGEDWLDVSGEVTDEDALMSNEKRDKGSIWDQGW